MKYIDAIKGSLIALIIVTIAVIYVPTQESAENIQIILTMSTFLFAILAGFFISSFNSRFKAIKDYIAEEDAYWISLYRTSILLGKKFQGKIKKIIDNYYITVYDFQLGEYYKYNSKYLGEIHQELSKFKSKPEGKFIGLMVMECYNIEKNRNKSSVLTSEKVTKGQWSILFILTGIIILSIFSLRTPLLYSQITTIMFSTALILVILILRDLQNGRVRGTSILTETGQEIFESIGNLRYYNQKQINSGYSRVPKSIKKYRLGIHKPGEKQIIKIIKK